MKLNTIQCIGGVEGMQQIEDESVDLVFTGPPYPDSQKRDGFEIDDYNEWIIPFYDEIFRILKPSGSLVIIGHYNSNKILDPWIARMVVGIHDIGFDLLQDFYWIKPGSPPLGLASRHVRARMNVEQIYWFAKASESVKVDTHNVRKYANNKLNEIESLQGNKPIDTKINTFIDTSTPFNIILGSPMLGESDLYKLMKEIGINHPGRIPAFIPEFFIRMLTEEGDIIVDPFAGSGTTAVAAKECNRYYIGYEINRDYVKLANIRLERIKYKSTQSLGAWK